MAEVEINCTFRIKTFDKINVLKSLAVEIIPDCIGIVNIIKGDVTGDDAVDSNDAIYLLYHTLIPEHYYLLK